MHPDSLMAPGLADSRSTLKHGACGASRPLLSPDAGQALPPTQAEWAAGSTEVGPGAGVFLSPSSATDGTPWATQQQQHAHPEQAPAAVPDFAQQYPVGQMGAYSQNVEAPPSSHQLHPHMAPPPDMLPSASAPYSLATGVSEVAVLALLSLWSSALC